MNTPATDSNGESKWTFEDWVEILNIPPERWNESLIQKGIAFLIRAESLQVDLSTASLDIRFGREEVLMRIICQMIKDKITGKYDPHSDRDSDYIRGKFSALGYIPEMRT